MNSNNHTYSPNDIMQDLKDGTEVILFEKDKNKVTNTIMARMVNVVKIHDDYKFNLINNETNSFCRKKMENTALGCLKHLLKWAQFQSQNPKIYYYARLAKRI